MYNMRRCCEILDIRPNASFDEAKQAFRDLVNVWHPDKYSNNPRLMEKADVKLKEINWAWEQFQACAREQERLEEHQRHKEREEAKRQHQSREKKLMVLSELRTSDLDITATISTDIVRNAYRHQPSGGHHYDPDPGLSKQDAAFVQPETSAAGKTGRGGHAEEDRPGFSGEAGGYVLLKEAVVDHVQRHPDVHDSLVRSVKALGLAGHDRIHDPHRETVTEVNRKMTLLSECYVQERREKNRQERLGQQEIQREIEENLDKTHYERKQNHRVFTERYLDRYRSWLADERERFEAAEHVQQRRSGIYRVLRGVEKQREFPYGIPHVRMILIPGGTFAMGRDDKSSLLNKITGHSNSHPRHTVTLRDFYLSKYPVTEKQWSRAMGVETPELYQNMPVQLNWNDVQRFIGRLNDITGLSFRLPTEAEWEYAARSGGVDEKWPGEKEGATIFEHASVGRSHVGLQQPNGLGLCDMLGNVAEWSGDWYDSKYYARSAELDPNGPELGIRKVVRGSVIFDAVGHPMISDAFSRGFLPVSRFNRAGFRLAHSLL